MKDKVLHIDRNQWIVISSKFCNDPLQNWTCYQLLGSGRD
jgi:hypothetical protein